MSSREEMIKAWKKIADNPDCWEKDDNSTSDKGPRLEDEEGYTVVMFFKSRV